VKIIQEDRAIAQAERKFLEETYKGQCSTALQHSGKVNANILSLAQSIINSASPQEFLPIFESLAFTDLYGRIRACIHLRYQTSNQHGVMTNLSKLVEVKMALESQGTAHAFIDKIKSLKLRIRTHLRDGDLDLAEVIEIRVMLNGMSKRDGWPVLATVRQTKRFRNV